MQQVPGKRVLRARIAAAGAVLTAALVGPASAIAWGHRPEVPCHGPGGGAAALIAAIGDANSAGGGAVFLDEHCTYALTTFNNTGPSGANGLPVITAPITIYGDDATIAGNPAGSTPFRIFEVSGGSLTLDDVTVTGGATGTPPSPQDLPFGAGGGVLDLGGTVTLDHANILNNTATVGGGGVATANGTVSAFHSRVLDNIVSGPFAGGGGIFAKSATVVLDHIRVSGNSSGSGGGGILAMASSLTLQHSRVTGNSGLEGGGIAAGRGNGSLPLDTSTLTIDHSEISGNSASVGAGPGAGGVANGGLATITDSRIDGNSAPNVIGGGLVNHGAMTISRSQIDGNSASGGGGGGILNLNDGAPGSGTLTIERSDVNGNTAGSGIGGGILNSTSLLGPVPPSSLTLIRSEVRDNTALGGGGGIFNNPDGSTVTLVSPVRVSDNQVDNCEPLGTIPGCTG